jgi:hypothetical protein
MHSSVWQRHDSIVYSLCERNEKMTQEIIEMAQECGLIGMRPHLDGIYSEALIEFAKLVAAKEREACANMVDHILKEGGNTYGDAIRGQA